jgi:hypothetical protein
MKATITLLSAMAIAASLSFGQDAPAGPPKGPGGPGCPGGPHKRPEPEKIFKKLDTNADSSLSLDEFKAGPMGKKDPAKAEEIFKKIDADNSGGVSLEEFKSHRPRHDGKGGKGKDKGGEPAPAPAAE